jgi:DNA processing protein
MNENETIAKLRLQVTPGIGPVNARKLVQHFGSATEIFRESELALLQIPGIGRVMVKKLLNENFRHQAECEFDRIQKNGIRCLALGDPDYPPLLSQCEDAPLLLFLRGTISFEKRRFVSIVGTRNMTSRGRSFCERFVSELAPYGPVVVSGLAYGVDICAHQAALKQKLETIACLAHGLGRVYPQTHSGFVRKIEEQGGLLTEFWWETTPEPMHFVRRNRIIAGLSEATIVVESAVRGGGLITADLAFGYNREVFSVPGRPGDVFSQGCNLMIRDQKAQLLQSAEEFVNSMNWGLEGVPNRPAKAAWRTREDLEVREKMVAGFLSDKGQQLLDEIAFGCQQPVQVVAAVLFQLEMKGVITALAGKRFRLKGG